jgi:hypothetical protein
MILIDQIKHYANLLIIFLKARRRNTVIFGGLFLVSFLAMIGTGLVSGLESREIYLVAGINVGLGVGFLMTWVRLEVLLGSIELLENLQRAIGTGSEDTPRGDLP